jgi:hypothetical protein
LTQQDIKKAAAEERCILMSVKQWRWQCKPCQMLFEHSALWNFGIEAPSLFQPSSNRESQLRLTDGTVKYKL